MTSKLGETEKREFGGKTNEKFGLPKIGGMHSVPVQFEYRVPVGYYLKARKFNKFGSSRRSWDRVT